jgi:tripartite-type tricarboxylate transporter receptor subunit TctC
MKMTLTKRALTIAGAGILAGLSSMLVFSGTAIAQAWPDKPITFIVPFPAGGGTDIFARPTALALEALVGQRIIIDNRGGAGGTVGASAASKAAGDGYTFFIGAAHHTIAPSIYPKLDYNLETDFIPIGMIAQPPQVIVVNPDKVPARTMPDFIAFLKANPGKLNYASSGNGTTHHLAGELFKLSTGTQITHVPYRGAGPAVQDLLAGHVQIMFDGLGTSSSQISSKSLHAIALASPTRSSAIPDVPTTAEAGLPSYQVSTWYGLWAVKGTPPAVVERMTKELKTVLATADTKDRWMKNGSDVPTLFGADFAKHINTEIGRWGQVVKDANIKID